MLSVVIPTRDAAAGLGATLAALGPARESGLVREVLVADCGSTDGTVGIAEAAGARVVRAAPGRGVQLAAGAGAAGGDWLFFLHADTRPGPGWEDSVARFLAAPGAEGRAAVMSFVLDSARAEARRIERLVAWRTRVLGLPYGDQGLILSRRLYEDVGGFRPLPLMEDVDIVRRIGRARISVLPAAACTSARRYERDGWVMRPLRNLLCLSLWRLGMPARLVARLYG